MDYLDVRVHDMRLEQTNQTTISGYIATLSNYCRVRIEYRYNI